MPICPKCKEEIDDLNFSADVESYGNYDGYDWNTKENGEWKDEKFYCPKCNEELAFDEEEATNFLQNKDKLTELVKEKIKNGKKKKGN